MPIDLSKHERSITTLISALQRGILSQSVVTAKAGEILKKAAADGATNENIEEWQNRIDNACQNVDEHSTSGRNRGTDVNASVAATSSTCITTPECAHERAATDEIDDLSSLLRGASIRSTSRNETRNNKETLKQRDRRAQVLEMHSLDKPQSHPNMAGKVASVHPFIGQSNIREGSTLSSSDSKNSIDPEPKKQNKTTGLQSSKSCSYPCTLDVYCGTSPASSATDFLKEISPVSKETSSETSCKSTAPHVSVSRSKSSKSTAPRPTGSPSESNKSTASHSFGSRPNTDEYDSLHTPLASQSGSDRNELVSVSQNPQFDQNKQIISPNSSFTDSGNDRDCDLVSVSAGRNQRIALHAQNAVQDQQNSPNVYNTVNNESIPPGHDMTCSSNSPSDCKVNESAPRSPLSEKYVESTKSAVNIDVHDVCSPELVPNKPLRSYQQEMIEKLVHAYKNSRNKRGECSEKPMDDNLVSACGADSVLVYLPTGAGKTRVACELIQEVFGMGETALFVVNRSALVDQTYTSLSELGMGSSVGFIKAQYEETHEKPIVIASIQSLRSRKFTVPVCDGGLRLHFDLVVVDEAHAACSRTYLSFLKKMSKESTLIVGLSATPVRLNPQESLATVFSRLLMGPSISELVRNKFLAPPKTIVVSMDIITKLQELSKKNNRIDSEAEALLATQVQLEKVVEKWQTYASERKTIAFCMSIDHSIKLTEAFQSVGVEAAHIDGTTSQSDRTMLFQMFREGAIQVLSSVNVLSEGFDEPSVSCVLMLRPTQSKGLYIQQVGRGLRLAKNKTDCVILDQSGNVIRHGTITGPRGYTIEDLAGFTGHNVEFLTSFEPSQRRKKMSSVVQVCPMSHCQAVMHSSASVCEICGTPLPNQRKPSQSFNESDTRLTADQIVQTDHFRTQCKKLRIPAISMSLASLPHDKVELEAIVKQVDRDIPLSNKQRSLIRRLMHTKKQCSGKTTKCTTGDPCSHAGTKSKEIAIRKAPEYISKGTKTIADRDDKERTLDDLGLQLEAMNISSASTTSKQKQNSCNSGFDDLPPIPLKR